MTAAEIEIASKGLSFFDKIGGWLRRREQIALKLRVDAINSVHVAAAKTRQYTQLIGDPYMSKQDCERWEDEISNLWIDAANKVAELDKQLSVEMYVKAYGWSRGGVWDSPEFEIIPRKVEEIYADTLRFLKEYEPILKS